jgi:hypothetical protein
METTIVWGAIAIAAYMLGTRVQRRARRRQAIMRQEIAPPSLVLCRRCGARN